MSGPLFDWFSRHTRSLFLPKFHTYLVPNVTIVPGIPGPLYYHCSRYTWSLLLPMFPAYLVPPYITWFRNSPQKIQALNIFFYFSRYGLFTVGPRLEWSEPEWHFRYESTFRQRLYFLLNNLNINHSPWLLEEQCFKAKNENTWIYSVLGQYYCSWFLTSIRFGFWLGQFFEVEENLFVHFGFEQSETDYRG